MKQNYYLAIRDSTRPLSTNVTDNLIIGPRTYVSESDLRFKNLLRLNKDLIYKMNLYKRRYRDCKDLLKRCSGGEKVFTGGGGNLVGGIYSEVNNKRKFGNGCGFYTESSDDAGGRVRARGGSCRGKEGGREGSLYDWEYSEFEQLAEANDYQVIDKECNFITSGKGKVGELGERVES